MRLRGVTKRYSNGTLAVTGVDLELRAGEFVSLLGPSGCGKTTLLRMIAGLADVSAGRIEWPNAARDGRECVAMAQINVPDLFLIDLSMPVLDGWGTLSALRESETTCAVPCIAITAFSDPDRTRHPSSQDFDAYITKPFKSKELLDTVERLLEERAARL